MIDRVHIWRAALDEPGWPGPQQLPGEERERAERFLRPEAARRWVASRWALRRVLGEHLGVAPAAVELDVGEHGKPRLRGAEGPEFNLCHSEGLALVAVAEHEVGIDVEAIRPRRNLVALAERALPQADAVAVRTADAPARPAVFYATWTRHEARLKCLGSGLAANANLQFPTCEGGNCRFARPAVKSIDVGPGHAAALAVAAPEVGPIQCRTLRAG